MAKRFLYIVCLLIICNLIAVHTDSLDSDTGNVNNLGADDLDSFFEGIEDAEELIPHQATEQHEERSREPEVVQEQQELYYPPPEPIPEFESDTEKYIYYARKYLVEICLALLVVVFILNFFVGKKVNTKIAAMWLSEAVPLLRNNFAHLGFGEDSNLSLSQMTYNDFEFFASGRDFCHYMFMHLTTKKRQDVVTGSLFGLLWPEKDRLIVDIPIDVDLPLEILVCRKQNVRRTQQEMPNINQLIAPMKVDRFNNTNIAVLAESGETVDIVINKRFSNAFEKYEKFLEFLHITDQRVYTNYPLVLKAEILLGDTPAEYKESVKLVEVLLELVDHIATNVKLPPRVMEQAKKNREVEEKKREKVRVDKSRFLKALGGNHIRNAV